MMRLLSIRSEMYTFLVILTCWCCSTTTVAKKQTTAEIQSSIDSAKRSLRKYNKHRAIKDNKNAAPRPDDIPFGIDFDPRGVLPLSITKNSYGIYDAQYVGSTRPSTFPSRGPSPRPSAAPSASPSAAPTAQPSRAPSEHPRATPSALPSDTPSHRPSATPSRRPSRRPTAPPSPSPSGWPTQSPSVPASPHPSARPSGMPSRPLVEFRVPPADPAPGGGATAIVMTPMYLVLYPLAETLPLDVFQLFCDISDRTVLESFIDAAKDPRTTIQFSTSLLSQEVITLPDGKGSGLLLRIRKEGLVSSSFDDKSSVISQKFLDVAFEMLYNSVTKEDRLVKTLRSVQLDLFRELTSVKLYAEVYGDTAQKTSQTESWESAAGLLGNRKLLIGLLCGAVVTLGLCAVVLTSLCTRPPVKEDARTVDLTVNTDAIETQYNDEDHGRPVYYVTSTPPRSSRSTRTSAPPRSTRSVRSARSSVTPSTGRGGEQSSES